MLATAAAAAAKPAAVTPTIVVIVASSAAAAASAAAKQAGMARGRVVAVQRSIGAAAGADSCRHLLAAEVYGITILPAQERGERTKKARQESEG